MVTAYFDCQFGAAGDMLIAALLDAGLDRKKWLAELQKIALPAGSFSVRIERVTRCTIAATKFDVDISRTSTMSGAHPRTDSKVMGEPHSNDYAQERSHDHGADHDHTHTHTHVHAHHHYEDHARCDSHGHSQEHLHSHADLHDHSIEHVHSRGGETQTNVVSLCEPQPEYNPSFDSDHLASHGRTLSEVIDVIEKSQISAYSKDLSIRIFQRMARAEAKVHGVPVDSVHFHEVGAVDAIVDIVGFAIAFELMNIEQAVVSRVPTGSGYVRTSHGLLPVPAPAVVNLMSEASMIPSQLSLEYECLTPTGAAILAEIGHTQGGTVPSGRILGSGYGAGTKDLPKLPNVCRVFLCETATAAVSASTHSFRQELVTVIEANIDDMTPQAIGSFIDTCMSSGALDVSVVPCTMKKSRPGHLLTVLCKPEQQEDIETKVLVHTTSLGVRTYTCFRRVAERESVTVRLSERGSGLCVTVKLGRDNAGKVVNVQPEWQDCCAYAEACGLPVKQVYLDALAAYFNQYEKKTSKPLSEFTSTEST